MIDAERRVEKYRRQYDDAATTMQAAVTEAALRTVTHVIATETGAAENAVRAEVKEQGRARALISESGRMVASVVRSVLAEPFCPGAFDEGTFALSKLFATAYRSRGAAR
ncbi:MAG: hypothetical protein ABI858_02215 [Pseudoxanthomonas sp.]